MMKNYYSPDAIIRRLIIRDFLVKRMKRKNPELYKKFLEQQKERLEEEKYWFF